MASALMLLLAVLTQQTPTSIPTLPSADSIRAHVTSRAADPRFPGLAVGRLAGPDTLRITTGRGITRTTLFEIGSITKAFTGVLLADMVLRGEVALDDPVAKFLPEGSRVPERDGAVITLRHLATHTSGLPPLPSNLAPANWDDPYADYDQTRLLEFLASHQLRRAPGAQYEYSNLGAGLLGYALARRSGTTYGRLVQTRILERLGMTRSSIGDSPAAAIGHDGMGQPTSAWHLDALAGAGAIRSSLDDMLRFAAAARDTVGGPLGPAMALSQRQAFRVDSITSVGLGWHRRTRNGRTLIWHNGGTGGFRSMLVVDPGASRAGIALGNSAVGVDDLGFALIDSATRLAALPPARATVRVDAATLARYPGVYRLTPAFALTITPRGRDGLYLQATGQQRFRLYATSPTEFFISEVAASITFEADSSGKVNAVILHQNGANQRALRER